MSGPERVVTVEERPATDRLPDQFSQAVLLLQYLESVGRLGEIAKRLQIQRQGGYHGIDVLIFLLVFFASEIEVGIKEFGERTRKHRRQLAAVGGRRTLPAPASVSRLLSVVDEEDCSEFVPWLLLEGCDAKEVLSHPAVLSRDTAGQAWHVFDFDPTSTVLRHRALPEGDDLPTGRRRSDECKLGYGGRKRGDVQLSRATLQHAGSGLWTGIWTSPGNGRWRKHSQQAIDAVVRTCHALGHSPGRALLRVDGAGGNTPFIAACQAAGVAYLTRVAHYSLLDEPMIRRHLNEAIWYEVQDSGSGPKRQAAELGCVSLPCDPSTKQSDGTPYERVRTRVIVSRFRSDKSRGSGRLIDGWHYELFATGLHPEPWPTPEVVTTYYGRCGQENRFAQEDREFGLDRIFSYHLPGQNLANVVGLFVWNLRICRGMQLARPSTEIPEQLSREANVAAPNVQLSDSPSDQPQDPASDAPEASAVMIPAANREHVEQPDQSTAVAVKEPPTNEAASSPPTTQPTNRTGDPVQQPLSARQQDNAEHNQRLDDAQSALCIALNALDLETRLYRHPGWNWVEHDAAIVCPSGAKLTLADVKMIGSGATGQLRFRASLTACRSCTDRSRCTRSEALLFRKELTITVPGPQATHIADLLAIVQRYQLPALPAPRASTQPGPRPSSDPPSTMSTWRSPAITEAGALALTSAVLLPAALRHAFCRACRHSEAYVGVHLFVPPPQDVVPCAVDAADRQHQRLSWTERCRANALLPQDQVRIRFAIGHDAGRLPEILALPKPLTASRIPAGLLHDSAVSCTSACDPC